MHAATTSGVDWVSRRLATVALCPACRRRKQSVGECADARPERAAPHWRLDPHPAAGRPGGPSPRPCMGTGTGTGGGWSGLPGLPWPRRAPRHRARLSARASASGKGQRLIHLAPGSTADRPLDLAAVMRLGMSHRPPSARTLPDAVLAVRVDAESAQTNADLEVVLTADSLDEIKRIHGRYFLTPAQPVRASLVRTQCLMPARGGRTTLAARAAPLLRPLQPALVRREHPIRSASRHRDLSVPC
jgi:hypothetical protein